MTRNKIKKLLLEITLEAGILAKKKKEKALVKYTKSHEFDFVTDADLACNSLLINRIKKEFPEHSIISEEFPAINNKSEYSWIIDPIDGTLNYKRKHYGYAVMVTVTKKTEVIMSAIYLPELDYMYFAEKGNGAFLNGKRIRCSQEKNIGNSRGIITAKLTPERIAIEKNLLKVSKGHLNAECAYAANSMFTPVMNGSRDWVIAGGGGQVWDYAPSYLLLKEAGCKVTGIKGEKWTLRTIGIIAANPKLHNELMKIIRR